MKSIYLIRLCFVTISLLAVAPAYSQITSKFKNNAAVRELKTGDVAKAEELMGKALESDAADPIILYNWATMNLHSVTSAQEKASKEAPKSKDELSDDQKKKVESSRIEFEQFLKSNKLPSRINKKELYYQNALAQELLGNNKDALKNYYQSLAADNVGMDDAELRKLTEKTQINISRLLVKSQSSSSGQGGGGGGGSEGQSSKGEGSEGKENNQGQGSGGQQQSKQQPEFSGTDVNQSQAQQILNSVSNQDRQVQQRKGQQQSKQNMQNGEQGDPSPRDNDKPW